MGQLFCYLVYCTIDPWSHEDHTKWKSEKMKIRDKRQKQSCICLSNSPRHRPAWNVVFASDAEILTGPPKFLTEPPQIETKPSQPRWFPLVQLKYNWKNYPQGNISSLESSLKTNLWRKFPIQICKGQGATKKLLKPRCGSIELNIRAGF